LPVNVSEETKVASKSATVDKTGIKAVEPAAIDQLPSTIQTPSAVVVATGEAQTEAKKDEDPFAKMRTMLQQLSAEREKSSAASEHQKPEPPAAQTVIAPQPATPEKIEEPTSDAKASANVTVVVDKAEVEKPSPVTVTIEPNKPLMLAAATPATPKEERAQVAQAPLPDSPEPEAKPVEKMAPFKGLREALEAEKKSSEAAAVSAEPPANTSAEAPEEKKTVKPLTPVMSEPLVPEMDEPERVKLPAGMDPMDQLVNIDFREMDLSQVVSLLAKKAGVNVIAGTDVVGTVTADMKNIPLRKAMDMVLRMNGLGIVEEEGIYRIVTYDEAVAARRATRMVALKNAQAEDVKTTLDGVLVGSPDATAMAVSANSATNVIIISGPREKVEEYVKLANELDIKEPTLPTVTEAVKLNYLEPKAAKPIAESMITKDLGKIEIDEIGRHLVITDIPVVVEQIREMLTSVDIPVKQVAIDAMIVDVVLRDASQTGVNWLLEALRRHSTNGDLVSDVSQLDFESTLGNIGTEALDAGVLTLGILSSEARLTSSIAAEVQSRNAEILANPSVVTVENKPATISIVQEFPYQEITQGLTGPPVASTEFKPIGVTLEVTPRVTHDNSTIVNVQAKQSSVSGLTESGVPIEDKREAETTLRAQDGRTIFIGGLRNVTDRLSVSKVPVLGDIPVLNLAFRSRDLEKINTELMIFLTCRVMGEELPELTPNHQENFNKIGLVPEVPDSQRAMFRDIAKPQEMRDPAWKWRRSK
ncbi:MAG: secretin N-terminal domain-containing protein, partial [Candidatus Hydrogenedentales bacterium]|jgi:type II secretory pathway component GspD/PulD (secretin)